MAKHIILGQEVVFSLGEELFCGFKTLSQEMEDSIISIFGEWYIECQDIETVLDNYLEKAADLVLEYSCAPLFTQLPKFEIYDVGQKEFNEKCVDLTCIKETYEEVLELYKEIVIQQEAEHEYREMRKAARGRIVGGGFGIGGALKGMATAGLMNAAAGAIHSIGNSLGNANSDMEAENLKKKLYSNENTILTLLVGIQVNISEHFELYTNFLSQRLDKHIYFNCDEDKSEALFRNAVNIPEKRDFLLAEAFRANPWNRDLYEYIFKNFPEERKNILELGQTYGINLRDSVEENREDAGSHEMEETIES